MDLTLLNSIHRFIFHYYYGHRNWINNFYFFIGWLARNKSKVLPRLQSEEQEVWQADKQDNLSVVTVPPSATPH